MNNSLGKSRDDEAPSGLPSSSLSLGFGLLGLVEVAEFCSFETIQSFGPLEFCSLGVLEFGNSVVLEFRSV